MQGTTPARPGPGSGDPLAAGHVGSGAGAGAAASGGAGGVDSESRRASDEVGRAAEPRMSPQLTQVRLETSFTVEQRKHLNSFAIWTIHLAQAIVQVAPPFLRGQIGGSQEDVNPAEPIAKRR